MVHRHVPAHRPRPCAQWEASLVLVHTHMKREATQAPARPMSPKGSTCAARHSLCREHALMSPITNLLILNAAQQHESACCWWHVQILRSSKWSSRGMRNSSRSVRHKQLQNSGRRDWSLESQTAECPKHLKNSVQAAEQLLGRKQALGKVPQVMPDHADQLRCRQHEKGSGCKGVRLWGQKPWISRGDTWTTTMHKCRPAGTGINLRRPPHSLKTRLGMVQRWPARTSKQSCACSRSSILQQTMWPLPPQLL
jgi:hypothetical protein